MTADREAAIREPLNLRLRAEANEWDNTEPIPALLNEAAEAVEVLAAELAAAREQNRLLREALRAAEGLLTQGSGSPECHYALGIIRSALNAAGEQS